MRRLNGRGEAADDEPEAGVVADGVEVGAFRGRDHGAVFVVGDLLASEIATSHHLYARARDMVISMSCGFWSLTSIFSGSRRPAV